MSLDNEFKYGYHLLQEEQYVYRNSFRTRNNKRDSPFFRHPYLETGSTNQYDVEVTIHTGYNADHDMHGPEIFVGRVWTIPVRNTKHSIRTVAAKDCTADTI